MTQPLVKAITAVLLGLALAGCATTGPTPTAIATPTPTHTLTPAPMPTPTPAPSPLTVSDVEASLRTLDATLTLEPTTDPRDMGNFPRLVLRPKTVLMSQGVPMLGVVLIYPAPELREANQPNSGDSSIQGPSGNVTWDGIVHSAWVGVENVIVEVVLPGGQFGGRSPTPAELALPDKVRAALEHAPSP